MVVGCRCPRCQAGNRAFAGAAIRDQPLAHAHRQWNGGRTQSHRILRIGFIGMHLLPAVARGICPDRRLIVCGGANRVGFIRRQRREIAAPFGYRVLRRFARQHVDGLFAHHDVTGGRREHGQQRDRLADAAQRVPRNPNTVRRAQLGGGEALAELFRRKTETAAGCFGWRAVRQFLVGVHDQLAFDGDGLLLGVVEIQAAAETACRRLSGLAVHRIGPNRDQPHRDFESSVFPLVAAARQGQGVGHLGQAAELHGLTAGERDQCQRGQPTAKCHKRDP